MRLRHLEQREHRARQFSPLEAPSLGSADTSTSQKVPVYYKDEDTLLWLSGDQTLLEAGLEANLDLMFSCQMGGCAACKVKILHGDVVMDEPNCLSQEERAEGYCLACVARPVTPTVVVS